MTEEELRQLNDSIAAEKSEQIDSEQAAIAEEIRAKEEEEAQSASPQPAPTPQPSQTAPQPPVASETPPKVETPTEPEPPAEKPPKGDPNNGDLNGTIYKNSGVEGMLAQGLIDFTSDAIGNIGGLGWVDDQYDEKTKWANEELQKVREKMSLISPALITGIGATFATGGLALPAVGKGLLAFGLSTAADVGITALSDESEKQKNLFRDLNDAWPQLNISENFQTLDGDSPEVRTQKHLYDSIGLSIVGESLGYALQLGKPILRWFRPLNRTAENYKASQLSTMIDSDTAKALSDIDEIVSTGEVDPKQLDNLLLKKNQLIQESTETGSSSVSRSGYESSVERAQTNRQMQIDQDGMDALREAPDSIDYNPNITSAITDPVNTPRLTVDAGSVAKNMLDTTAIQAWCCNR
jgi:hypothetical protein